MHKDQHISIQELARKNSLRGRVWKDGYTRDWLDGFCEALKHNSEKVINRMLLDTKFVEVASKDYSLWSSFLTYSDGPIKSLEKSTSEYIFSVFFEQMKKEKNTFSNHTALIGRMLSSNKIQWAYQCVNHLSINSNCVKTLNLLGLALFVDEKVFLALWKKTADIRSQRPVLNKVAEVFTRKNEQSDTIKLLLFKNLNAKSFTRYTQIHAIAYRPEIQQFTTELEAFSLHKALKKEGVDIEQMNSSSKKRKM